MSSRRGATGLRGILLVDKPAGPTSHDVVAAIRRATGEGRIGHAGTLDPLATGLLVILVGAYTRLEPYLSSACKSYAARIAFGMATDTDDAEGIPTETGQVHSQILDPDYAYDVLRSFIGRSMQVPPAYSAIKVNGRSAHRSARAGERLRLAARPIEVHSARLTHLSESPPSWSVDFVVSKGTYIRALARDIGESVGCPAHLASLRRLTSGPLDVADASPLDDLVASSPDAIAARFTDPFVALDLPVVDVDPSWVANGRRFPSVGPDGERVAVRASGRLAGVYHRWYGMLVPDIFFPE